MSGYLEFPDGSRRPIEHDAVIGRDPGCAMPLAATGVSRRHARIVVEHGVVEIEDLESRNGVLLNGTKVSRRMLRDGDVVQLGRAQLTYVASAEDREEDAAGAASAGPAPGEDLLGGDDLLEEEPDLSAAPARPPAAEVIEPRPAPAPAPAPQSPPPPPPAQPSPELASTPSPLEATEPVGGPVEDDVIEFVDEVVAVRPPKPAPASPSMGAAAAGRPSAPKAARSEGAHGVLQFQNRGGRGGVLTDDLSQSAGAGKFVRVLIAVALAAAMGYGAFVLSS